jgi:hypothetical protein
MSAVSDTGPSKAKENLNKAIEIFTYYGADGWVTNMKKNWLRFHKKNPSENLCLVFIPLHCKLNVTAKKTIYL